MEPLPKKRDVAGSQQGFLFQVHLQGKAICVERPGKHHPDKALPPKRKRKLLRWKVTCNFRDLKLNKRWRWDDPLSDSATKIRARPGPWAFAQKPKRFCHGFHVSCLGNPTPQEGRDSQVVFVGKRPTSPAHPRLRVTPRAVPARQVAAEVERLPGRSEKRGNAAENGPRHLFVP